MPMFACALRKLRTLVSATLLVAAGSTSAWATSHAEYMTKISGWTWFAWQKFEFDTIEKWADEFRDPKLMKTNGYSYLVQFYPGFWNALHKGNLADIDKDWKYAYEIWQQRKPGSPTPHLVHAAKLVREASLYRGVGPMGSVSDKDFQRAFALWAEASELLLKHSDAGDVDYAWYAMMIQLESNLPIDKADAYRRLLEGIDRHPHVGALYLLGSTYLLPEWGGSWEQFNAWVASSVKATRERYGMGMYAFIYSQFTRHRALRTQQALSPVHWRQLKQGIADIQQRFPHMGHNSWFVDMACTAGDDAAFHEYMAELIKRVNPGFKGAVNPRDTCDPADFINDGFSMRPLPIPSLD